MQTPPIAGTTAAFSCSLLARLSPVCSWPITLYVLTRRPAAAGVAMSRWSPPLRESAGCRSAGTHPTARPSGRGTCRTWAWHTST
jgi:hypothetical protein